MAKKIEQFDFETTMSDLEKTVSEMEDGKLNLDEALKKYEDGIKMIRQCHDYLKKSEQKVQILKQLSPAGELENYAKTENKPEGE